MSETKTLYVIVCAAGPAADVGVLIDQAHERGWNVQVISTPAALAFIDPDALEKQTGRPVRSAHRAPGSPRSPKADAIIIAPATFNTINKLANGIADNYALDIANELLGTDAYLILAPYVNTNYANRAAFRKNVDSLRIEGAKILLEEDHIPPHAPGSEINFPWSAPLEILDSELQSQLTRSQTPPQAGERDQ